MEQAARPRFARPLCLAVVAIVALVGIRALSGPRPLQPLAGAVDQHAFGAEVDEVARSADGAAIEARPARRVREAHADLAPFLGFVVGLALIVIGDAADRRRSVTLRPVTTSRPPSISQRGPPAPVTS